MLEDSIFNVTVSWLFVPYHVELHGNFLGPDCGKVIYYDSGYIDSPNYPFSYYEHHNCTWIIHTFPGRKRDNVQSHWRCRWMTHIAQVEFFPSLFLTWKSIVMHFEEKYAFRFKNCVEKLLPIFFNATRAVNFLLKVSEKYFLRGYNFLNLALQRCVFLSSFAFRSRLSFTKRTSAK